MKTTLLVSTYESPLALDLTLRSVTRQTRLPDEILVADDGSGPDTRAVVHEAIRDFAGRGVTVRHVWHEDRGFRAGAIRNRALASAGGEYVVQIDGDVILHPCFVEEHLAWARPGHFLCGRRGDLTPEHTEAIRDAGVPPMSFGPGDFDRTMYAFHLPWLTPLFLRQYSHSWTKGVMGSNTSYWHADAIRINGYDEDFEGWGKEDNDFALRLMNAGVRRRTVVWSALQYHLHHRQNDRSRLHPNTARLEETRASGKVRCARGIERSEGTAEA